MIKIKNLILSLIFLCLVYAEPLVAQNNILYVEPKISTTSPDIINISKQIEGNIQSKILWVKEKSGYINYTSNTEKSNTSNYNTITTLSIRYVLKLAIVKVSAVYELQFSFYSIDKAKLVKGKKIEEERIEWENSTYIVKKESNGSYSNINEILIDINEEINFYFKYGKFRPRIYIDQQLFGPEDASNIIQVNNFCKWLEKTIQNSPYDKKYNYIIYYKNKKIYPDKASVSLYGEFIPIEHDDSRVNVVLKIKSDGEEYERPSVKIFIDDFNQGKYLNENEYKQKVVNNVYDLLDTGNNE